MKKFLIAIIFSIALNSSCKLNQRARIVLLPDTQTYSEKYPEIVHAQTDWILNQKSSIDLVLQQGDLTQNNNEKEWNVIKSAFSKLDNEVPYVLAVGNHDMGSVPGKFADVRDSRMFNQFFPIQEMSKLPAFGGTFEPQKMDNAYYFMKTGPVQWLILTLEFGPRNSVLDWASQIIESYANKVVIINTHAYMYSDSTRQDKKDYWRAQAYGIGKDTAENAVNDGEDIWRKLVKKHANIRFVFSGHVLNGGVGTLVSINNQGLPVYQMLANFQEGVKESKNGGNGWLRVLDMDFRKKTLSVKTYSPYLNQFNMNSDQEFIIREVPLKARNLNLKN